MFSIRNGWLIYSPLMSLGLIGLFYKNEIIRNYRFPLLLFMLVHFLHYLFLVVLVGMEVLSG